MHPHAPQMHRNLGTRLGHVRWLSPIQQSRRQPSSRCFLAVQATQSNADSYLEVGHCKVAVAARTRHVSGVHGAISNFHVGCRSRQPVIRLSCALALPSLQEPPTRVASFEERLSKALLPQWRKVRHPTPCMHLDSGVGRHVHV